MKTTRHSLGTRAGFTLMELLTVMAIIAIISTIALISYINMKAGGAYQSLSKNLQNHVMLARQQASLQNRPVCLMFTKTERMFSDGQKETQHEAVLVLYVGTVTDVDGVNFSDAFFTQGVRLLNMTNTVYNLETGGHFGVRQIVLETEVVEGGVEKLYDSLPTYNRPAVKYTLNTAGHGFQKGSAYGFELHQPYRLPKNFTFPNSQTLPIVIKFEGDGAMQWKEGASGSFTPVGAGISFNIVESIRSHPIKITIDADGVVTVNPRGNP